MRAASYKEIAEAILESVEDGGKDALIQAVLFLRRKGLLGESDLILSEMEKIENGREGKTTADIFSPHPLPVRLKNKLAQALAKRYSLRKIEWREHLNSGLLGGFRIETEGEVIDATLKGKIKKLEARLIS